MKKPLIPILFFIFCTLNSLSSKAIIPDKIILNPNEIRKELGKQLTESDYIEVSERISRVYSTFIKNNYQATLTFDNHWADDTVNAYAAQISDVDYHVHVSGGIVRARGMTKDSLALVLCHELGHHLGGAPKTFLFNGWPSSEGQADYWSSSKCLKKYFYELRNEVVDIGANIPEKIVSDCNHIYPDFMEMKICVRTILAGLDFANFLNELPNAKIPVKLETPDPKVVKGTNTNDYPRAQCRFDTIYAGALCNISSDVVNSPSDPSIGSCINELSLGTRPKCWFAK